MSPTNHAAALQLQNLIYYSLDNNLLKNALFFAGRLHGLEPRSSEAAYLVALCHLRLGELKAAHDHSKHAGSRGIHLGCSYVFAQACLTLSRVAEGITALEKSRGLWFGKSGWNRHSETRRLHIPDAAAVHCLMGKLSQAYDDKPKAVDNYTAALKHNPFMWDAFLGLCDMGVTVRVPNVFKLTPEMLKTNINGSIEDQMIRSSDDYPPLNISTNPPTNLTIAQDPFNSVPMPTNGDVRRPTKGPLYEKFNGSSMSTTPLPTTYEVHAVDTFETPVGSGQNSNGRGRDMQAQVLDESLHAEPPLAPARKSRPVSVVGSDPGVDVPRSKASMVRTRLHNGAEAEEVESTGVPVWNPSGMADRKRTASGQVAKTSVASTRNQVADPTIATARRSARLFNSMRPGSKASTAGATAPIKDSMKDVKKIKTTNAKSTAAKSTISRNPSGARRNGDVMDIDMKEARAIVPSGAPGQAAKLAASERMKEQEALRGLLDLLSKIASGYYCLSNYRSDEAMQIFKNLPDSQRETPWVLSQMGRALYEQAKYVEAEKLFSRMRVICPSRLDDLEIHSTVLWHLKAEVDLAHLAHELTEIDRLSPQAWCAVGNSLSLERNHEAALIAFRRATQIDPSFAYAWTLQGHEHVANEEYDKAMEAYRHGIEADSRHYNAWYGMGRVFEKQGKYDMAEAHYRFAANINPTNAVLICCIGGVLEKMKKPQLALDQYSRSCELAPRSALSRFKKARVLMTLGMWDRALSDLLVLKDIAPDEANVHFLLGRAYKTLRNKSEAIKHFTTALNLDPKASHHIKEAMEQMEDDYDDDDGEME